QRRPRVVGQAADTGQNTPKQHAIVGSASQRLGHPLQRRRAVGGARSLRGRPPPLRFRPARSLATMYGGHDPGCCACQFASWSEWLLGYPDTAIESINEGQRLAERLAVPLVLNQNLLFEAVLRLSRGESELALCRAREAGAHAIDQRLAPLLDPDI